MIYCDLDNTLIDSVRRLKWEMEAAARYGIDSKLYWTASDMALQKYGVGNFSYVALFEACRTLKPELSRKILEDWQEILAVQHFFPDTHTFLGEFPKEELILLTTGGREFQSAKIDTHNLWGRFSEVKIVPSPKCHHVAPTYPAVYLDDSPREIDAMKVLFPEMLCILTRQPAPWESQKMSLHADIRCTDLILTIEHIKQHLF